MVSRAMFVCMDDLCASCDRHASRLDSSSHSLALLPMVLANVHKLPYYIEQWTLSIKSAITFSDQQRKRCACTRAKLGSRVIKLGLKHLSEILFQFSQCKEGHKKKYLKRRKMDFAYFISWCLGIVFSFFLPNDAWSMWNSDLLYGLSFFSLRRHPSKFNPLKRGAECTEKVTCMSVQPFGNTLRSLLEDKRK